MNTDYSYQEYLNIYIYTAFWQTLSLEINILCCIIRGIYIVSGIAFEYDEMNIAGWYRASTW